MEISLAFSFIELSASSRKEQIIYGLELEREAWRRNSRKRLTCVMKWKCIVLFGENCTITLYEDLWHARSCSTTFSLARENVNSNAVTSPRKRKMTPDRGVEFIILLSSRRPLLLMARLRKKAKEKFKNNNNFLLLCLRVRGNWGQFIIMSRNKMLFPYKVMSAVTT